MAGRDDGDEWAEFHVHKNGTDQTVYASVATLTYVEY